jgi:diaminohydroxyphosphoribosylaminopyrimidine deaminase / 5-amino-6-(5-phosphoribosylamino)uracil reductase
VTADFDTHFMSVALALAARGLGSTWPNPSVGAVIVRETPDGPHVVGRGVTQPGGRPHAEAMALQAAGLAATGATMYVTLEPCSFRTVRGAQSCLRLSIIHGLRRVVAAIEDPNPAIAGLSFGVLRSLGIETQVGLLREEAAKAHRGHFTRLRLGRPFVTVKVARSADGYAGGAGGRQVAISCDEAMTWVHLQRAYSDAIMLAIGSVLSDDPLLNVRLPGMADRSPVRVILDSDLKLASARGAGGRRLRLLETARDIPTWVIATPAASIEAERILLAAGCEVMRVEADTDGRVDLAAALQLLGTRGLTRLFSEGGPTVAEKLAERDLIDEQIVSTSPRVLGEAGVVAVRPGLAARLADPLLFRQADQRLIGDDDFVWYERIR